MKQTVLIILGIVLLFSVSSCKKKNNRIEKDLPKTTVNNEIHVKINRFDKDLIQLNTADSKKSVRELYQKYPKFLPLFVTNVLEINSSDTLKVTELLTQFSKSDDFKSVHQKVVETFANVSDIEKELSSSFTKINMLYPAIKLPEIYFFVSGFNRAVISTDSILGIGSDFYLGADYKPYEGLTYKYLLQNMNRSNLATDVVSSILFKNFPFDGKTQNLLSQMLNHGKVIYLLSQIMPERKPEEIIGYTPNQLKWSLQFEKNIWKVIIGNKDLFATDVLQIRKYMNDAPFTTPVSPDSPGRLGNWIGWRIVESFMKNNKDVTIQQLMQMNDYQKMLEQSGYRP